MMNKLIRLRSAIIIWILVFILSISMTYAINTWNSGNTLISGVTMCFAIASNNDPDSLNKPTPINFTNLTASLIFDETKSASTVITFQRVNTSNCNSLYGLGTIKVNVTTTNKDVNLSTGALKYKIIDTTNSKEIANGSITQIGENIIYDNFYINEYVSYSVYIWLDANNIDNTYLEASFSGTITTSAVSTPTYINHDNLDTSGANIPKLVDGMIPIYYDETDGNWYKADKDNNIEEYKWYDYTNKQWANIVLVNDTSRETYMNASRGTIINMSDILAFYVWIPRYKYRVWSINRQACGSEDTATCESKYAYPAFSTGIDIQFEEGTGTTGNVKCTYNPYNTPNPSTLSDECIYNGTDVITTTTDNTKYTDAWYTHPAFTFGTQELTGFWVGKFETTGTSSKPTILPNVFALGSQNLAAQFMTSKLFKTSNTYGINNHGIDAHMLKNTEWGAIAYLSHSDYGMCNENNCLGIYINNSNKDAKPTTGRSGGAIAGETNTVAEQYPNSGDTSTNLDSNYGYYTYDGKIVNYDGTIGDYSSDKTLGTNASTTGNIYGIYDMNGGAYEYVMSDMYSMPTGTYVGPIGISASGFNGVAQDGSTLYSAGNDLFVTVISSPLTINKNNSKYYDSYSYGTSYTGQTSLNRSRLGDATGEITSGSGAYNAWKPGSGVTDSISGFPYSIDWHYFRGGYYYLASSSIFYFNVNKGINSVHRSFRSVLS